MNNQQLNRFFNRIATALCCMVGVGLFFAFGAYLLSHHTTALARQDSMAAIRLRFEAGLATGAGLGIYLIAKGWRDEADDD